MIEFNILIGTAYFNQPFVNIPVLYNANFPGHGAALSVYLGDWGVNLIHATINRNANPNHTPRIMMNIEYNNWVQENHHIGEELIITILNEEFPNSILIA